MKKQLLTLLTIGVLGLACWGTAQSGSGAPFDVRKSQQELEIMRGILSTTMGFVANELRSGQAATKSTLGESYGRHVWWSSGISAYYLVGQGAVFVIPVSGMHGRLLGDLDAQVEAATLNAEAAAEAMAELASGMGQGLGTGLGKGAGTTPAPVPAPAVAAPPPPPAPPAPPKVVQAPANQEQMKKRLAEAQEKVKKRQEYTEQQRQKLVQTVAQAKVHLIEALANYGDSMTSVKPNEYINLILNTDDAYSVGFGDSESRREIISVQKSTIIDYKAGRLSLDAFKQKVLQYQE